MAKKIENSAPEEIVAPVVGDEQPNKEIPVTAPPNGPIASQAEDKAPEIASAAPLSTQERIVEFLGSKQTGSFIPINDFLKSLYGVIHPNSPKPWHDQSTLKQLRNLLDGMVKAGQIVFESDVHLRLCKFHYPDSTTGVTHYWNLDTLQLKAKLP